ncbi:GGDEF domain-containing protein [Nitrincola alkalisediminis]|uniref:GGDEF domain-containing protein n=1 Tax=Nitrincola alkalisediminis TaxID=1366656 RepID=UPI001874FDE3|nr:GGDEF domain-containing protein [Nitrincola alkalisediminis]
MQAAPNKATPSLYRITRLMLGVFIPILILIGVFNGIRMSSDFEKMINQVEQDVIHSLQLIDDALEILEKVFDRQMLDGLDEFMQAYHASGESPRDLDLMALKGRFNHTMDVYIINSKGIVEFSTIEQDLGLDLTQWADFHEYLETIRAEGVPVVDRMSRETLTGLFRKYGYYPTPDKEWILELGIKPEVIAEYMKKLDPVQVGRRIALSNDVIDSIRIIDRLGWELSMSNPEQIEPFVLARANRVRETRQSLELVNWNTLTRYILQENRGHMMSFGAPDQVIELVYNRTGLITGIVANILVTLAGIIVSLILGYWLKTVEEELRKQAIYDGLTGVFNRRYGMSLLEIEINKASRLNSPLSCLLIDIDNFKKINDSYGHDVGDQVLSKVATELNQTLRAYDVFFRYGGEEFVIVFPGLSLEDAKVCSDRIRQLCAQVSISVDNDKSIQTTLSAGLVLLNQNETSKDLLKRADMALYEAKQGGRNLIRIAA